MNRRQRLVPRLAAVLVATGWRDEDRRAEDRRQTDRRGADRQRQRVVVLVVIRHAVARPVEEGRSRLRRRLGRHLFARRKPLAGKFNAALRRRDGRRDPVFDAPLPLKAHALARLIDVAADKRLLALVQTGPEELTRPSVDQLPARANTALRVFNENADLIRAGEDVLLPRDGALDGAVVRRHGAAGTDVGRDDDGRRISGLDRTVIEQAVRRHRRVFGRDELGALRSLRKTNLVDPAVPRGVAVTGRHVGVVAEDERTVVVNALGDRHVAAQDAVFVDMARRPLVRKGDVPPCVQQVVAKRHRAARAA